MANISVTVQDGNNITLVSTPTATQVITIDRGIAGPAGPAGVPGGSTTQVQYNLASAFAGSPNLTFDGTTLTANALTTSSTVTLSGGTANGVAYLNGSKVLTTGSALTFDGTKLTATADGAASAVFNRLTSNGKTVDIQLLSQSVGWIGSNGSGSLVISSTLGGLASNAISFAINGTEVALLYSSLLTVVPGALIQGLTVGRGAGAVATNTAVGASALAANTTGNNNTAVGQTALTTNTSGNFNTAVGRQSLFANTSGTDNSGFGLNSLVSNTTGSYNTAIGRDALQANTTASNNTAVGYQAGYSITTAVDNVAIGYRSGGYSNTATGGYNTTVGVFSGRDLTTGYANTYLGRATGVNTTTGYQNVAVGNNSLESNTTGFNNVAIGSGILGVNAGTLGSNTSGSANTAVGQQALYSNTTASNNTAVGYQAGYSNTTGTLNAYFGYQTANTASTASNNTWIGGPAGPVISTATGNGNTGMGQGAGASLTTGAFNTFVGAAGQINQGPGGLITTGSKNTILGGYNGNQGGLDIRTASNYIVLSDGDGNPLISTNSTRSVALNGAVPQTGTGITFPATQSASSNANTLDDYEEGTWTPEWSVSGGTIQSKNSDSGFVPGGTYTKIGNTVYIRGYISYKSETGTPSGALAISGLPFTPGTGFGQAQIFAGGVTVLSAGLWLSNPPTYAQIIPGSTTTNSLGYRTSTGGAATTYADMNRDGNYSQFVFQGQYTV